MPNWKPCVHSVQPREVYLPRTVKTGVPFAGSHAVSRPRIFAPARSKTRAVFFRSFCGVSVALIFMRRKNQKEPRNPPEASKHTNDTKEVSGRRVPADASVGCR